MTCSIDVTSLAPARRSTWNFDLPCRFIDVVSTSKMKAAGKAREGAWGLAERHIRPVEPHLTVRHVDTYAAIRICEAVMRKVIVARCYFCTRADGILRYAAANVDVKTVCGAH